MAHNTKTAPKKSSIFRGIMTHWSLHAIISNWGTYSKKRFEGFQKKAGSVLVR